MPRVDTPSYNVCPRSPPTMPATQQRPKTRGYRPTTAQLQRGHAAWEKGRKLAKSGQHAQAIQAFQEAVAQVPADGLYWLNLSHSEHLLGRIDNAIEHGQRALQLDPTSLVACHHLADLLRSEHHMAQVIQALDMLAPHVERDAQWHLLRGLAHQGLLDMDSAAQSFLAAMARIHDDPDIRDKATQQLGHCLLALRRHDEAATCYRMLVDADPRYLGSALYAAYCAAWSCDWTALDTDLERLGVAIAELRKAGPNATTLLSPFCLLTLADDPMLSRWMAEVTVNRPHPCATGREHLPVPRVQGKIRLGMLSADFKHHATTILLAEVLEHLDRNHFELYLYSTRAEDGSELGHRVRNAATVWHTVHDWSSERVARQMMDDQIGILFDLKGFTAGSRLDILARRPAPLQVAWLGYPGTTGARYIDYIVGDPVVTPLEHQAHFSEHIAQMPHCYQPNDSVRTQPAPLTRAQCGLPEDAFVFASFNQSYKIVPEVFKAWCHVLQQTPGSVLWLLVPQEVVQNRLRAVATDLGVDPGRLVFAPFVATDEHRARLPQIDLFLDSYPCSGHTTASDALWAGVPVLTLMGQTFASRVAASLLHTVGLPQLVCTDLDRYIEEAVRYAGDRGAIQALKQHLERQRTASPLFNGQRFAKDLCALLQRMVDRHDAGLPPDALAASSASLP